MIPSELLTIIGRRHFMTEIRTETAKQALGVVEAQARGGIAVFEISVAIPGSSEILHHFANQAEILVGAGGVVDAAQATEAAQAGARFIVAPIMSPAVLQACNDNHITCILGGLTPTEIIMAHQAGAEMVKVFPVNALGGSNYLRSLYRQFSNLHLLVAGGITLETLPEYLALPVRCISLGSSLMPRSLVERGDWVNITTLARRYVEHATAWEAATTGTPQRTVAVGRPMMGDTVMAPVPAHSTNPTPPSYPPAQPPMAPPTMPVAPPPVPMNPAHSDPARPISTPPMPMIPLIPEPPPEPPPFKPWDSKPAGTERDDWLR